MTRPTPRKSSLAGSSPIAPPPAAAPAQPAPSTPAAAPAPAVEPAAAPRPRRSAGGNKVAFYMSAQDAARMRGALRNTQHLTYVRGLSDFIAQAVMSEVERLERKHNDGQPWEPVGPGEIPTGRPMGE